MSTFNGTMEVFMPMGRPKPPLLLRPEESEQLRSVAASRTLPHGLVRRARIILLSASGMSNQAIATQLHLNPVTVSYWRRRFLRQGLQGLHGELRPGRPRSISDERVAALIRKTLQVGPKNATHWSCRSLAAQTRLSKTTVHRIWRAFGLQPHRQRHFQLSTDPFFVEKVRDIVGLYLNPPDKAVVLCVDEKSQIQALERTQPLLPLRPGQAERRAHDYKRHGTTSLFAALDAKTGAVLGKTFRRHRAQEFRQFLDLIEHNVPLGWDVHLILDNSSTHKTAAIRRWLLKRPRFHVHFTPTSSSWLNLVERWFAALTDRQLRRNSFRSTLQLEEAIREFLAVHNSQPKPFIWTKTADQILDSIARYCRRINDSGH